jgi:phosphoglucosamine mutase
MTEAAKVRQLFGTDGIRGVAGAYPLDATTVFLIGRALGRTLAHLHPSEPEAGTSPARVIIGEDTRESSRWIAETIAGGLREEGVEVHAAGVITTPGVAFLTRTDTFVAGVMISASHNPYQDNGIKVFGHSGFKLPDDLEHEIEAEIFRLQEAGDGVAVRTAVIEPEESFVRRYEDFLAGLLPTGQPLAGLRVVLDCGNGAAHHLAPRVFRRLGAEVSVMNDKPDGRNINLGCGSLHLDKLQARLASSDAPSNTSGPTIGAAFDGDADRCLFVTPDGGLVNGDGVLLLTARQMKEQGRLKNNLVVATVMSNLGLQNALTRAGIRMIRTQVGDKYVLEEMQRSGSNLGGEQSGHIIFSDEQSTGDGILTALRVALIVAQSGRPLADLVGEMPVYPQVLRNLKVPAKPPLESLPGVMAAIRESERELGDDGRVLVRYSGTENLVRIMVEAPDDAVVQRHVETIAAALTRELGSGK